MTSLAWEAGYSDAFFAGFFILVSFDITFPDKQGFDAVVAFFFKGLHLIPHLLGFRALGVG